MAASDAEARAEATASEDDMDDFRGEGGGEGEEQEEGSRWKSRILSDGREPFGLHTMRWRCGWPSKSWQVNGSFSLLVTFRPGSFCSTDLHRTLLSLSFSPRMVS